MTRVVGLLIVLLAVAGVLFLAERGAGAQSAEAYRWSTSLTTPSPGLTVSNYNIRGAQTITVPRNAWDQGALSGFQISTPVEAVTTHNPGFTTTSGRWLAFSLHGQLNIFASTWDLINPGSRIQMIYGGAPYIEPLHIGPTEIRLLIAGDHTLTIHNLRPVDRRNDMRTCVNIQNASGYVSSDYSQRLWNRNAPFTIEHRRVGAESTVSTNGVEIYSDAALSHYVIGGGRNNGWCFGGSWTVDNMVIQWPSGKISTLGFDDASPAWIASPPTGVSSASLIYWAPTIQTANATTPQIRPLHIQPEVVEGNLADSDPVEGLFDGGTEWSFILAPVGEVLEDQEFNAPPIIWAALIAMVAATAVGFAAFGLTQSWALSIFGGIAAMYTVAFMSPLPLWTPVLGLIIATLLLVLVRRPWD